MVDLMSAGPARVYGAVGKGRLAAGYDATEARQGLRFSDHTLPGLERRETWGTRRDPGHPAGVD